MKSLNRKRIGLAIAVASGMAVTAVSVLVAQAPSPHKPLWHGMRDKALRHRIQQIVANTNARHIPLSTADRAFLYSEMDRDRDFEFEGTFSLIAIAYRHADEKRRLVASLEHHFQSNRTSERYSAFLVVRYLQVPGFDHQTKSLYEAIHSKAHLTSVEQLELDDVREFLAG